MSYNYSNIKNRDKKLYSVSGTKISSTGISYKYIQVLFSIMLLFNMVGAVLCLIAGKFLYWPFTPTFEVAPAFLFIFVGSPFVITMALLHLKVQNHTLLDFLSAYLKPRKTRDEQGNVISYKKYEQDSFVDRII